MQFTIVANTYFQSTQKLSAVEIGRIDGFIKKLRENPAQPGLGLERIQGAADSNMWSGRVNKDLRAVLHHEGDRYMLLYVGHHDDSYDWARRRKVGAHPVTGTVQIVEIPEVTEQHVASEPRESEPSEETGSEIDFSRYGLEFLASLGVPEEWLEKVQGIRDEATFWNVYNRLPEEAAEYLYSLALGEEVTPPKPASDPSTPHRHPDSQRRMYELDPEEDLTALLSRPFAEWMLFLHPSQRSLVDAQFNGPAKVTGSAGTGKTVVAVHRAKALASQGHDVLLTTFTNRLMHNLQERVNLLCENGESERVTVQTVHRLTLKMMKELNPKKASWAKDAEIRKLIEEYAGLVEGEFDLDFIEDEWRDVIASHGLINWEEYRDISRVGRGTRLSAGQRERLWLVFDKIIKRLNKRSSWPWGLMSRYVREAIADGRLKPGFDAVIVDEVQDLSTPEIQLLSMLTRPEGRLMLIGDAGQRIYPGGFSLRSLGIETRGRSRQLNINYRTTREIERAANRLRGQEVEDLDGGVETGLATQCLLRGPKPVLRGFEKYEQENAFVLGEIKRLVAEGVDPREIGVLGRTKRSLYYFMKAVAEAGISVQEASKDDETEGVVFGTMHGAKGLEFRYVFVIGCRAKQLPASFALKDAKTDEEKEVVTQRERNLLYVSMTRARDQVWVSWTGNRSPFLDAVEPLSEVKDTVA